MNKALLILLVLPLLHAVSAKAETRRVDAPYIDVRTGPGRGFPVTWVLEDHELFDARKQRTDWIKVKSRDRHQRHGWIHASDLSHTTLPDGNLGTQRQDRPKRFGWSASSGDFGGAPVVKAAFAFNLTPGISFEAEAGQYFGEFSGGTTAQLSALVRPFPAAWISPYFRLGTGAVSTAPFNTVVAGEDRTDQFATVGTGTELRLHQRFTFTLDFRQHRVLTTRENNEEINEWTIGLRVAL